MIPLVQETALVLQGHTSTFSLQIQLKIELFITELQ